MKFTEQPIISDDCVICGPVIEAISQAVDAHQLLDLLRVKIPRLKGITDEQRAGLVKQVDRRFGALNAAAGVNQKPRWGSGGQQS